MISNEKELQIDDIVWSIDPNLGLCKQQILSPVHIEKTGPKEQRVYHFVQTLMPKGIHGAKELDRCDMYDTEKEAKKVFLVQQEKRLHCLRVGINSPEKLLCCMYNYLQKHDSAVQMDCLKRIFREKCEEFFGIKISIKEGEPHD